MYSQYTLIPSTQCCTTSCKFSNCNVLARNNYANLTPCTTQHNTTQHNTTQHNTTQHNTTQHGGHRYCCDHGVCHILDCQCQVHHGSLEKEAWNWHPSP